MKYQDIEYAKKCLVVSSSGETIFFPDSHPQGVFIVSEMDDETVLLSIGEVSDSGVLNAFLQVYGETSGIFPSEDYEWEYQALQAKPYKQWEILINREVKTDDS
tara:strand:+ start:1132 stop:1443 length:312 start_codon:yes stop_codon:yes gene_type:complete